MGAAPLVLDVETAKEANEALNKWTCTDAAEKVTEVEKDMVKCVAPGEKRQLAEGDCYENNWTNPNPADGTTSAMAVQAWYDQGKYFDYTTGAPTSEDKKKEAFEFINVVNKDTAKVGFAIKGPTVIGFYCPPADLSPDALKKSVPTVRKAPQAPTAPEGVALLDNKDAPCPILSGTEEGGDIVRAKCSEGNCCGASLQEGKESFDSCRPSEETSFTDDDEGTFTFSCYDDARRLAMSVAAIAVSVALNC